MVTDVVKLSKLVVVKQIFHEATQLASNTQSIGNRLMAIIALDFAVETFLKISAAELGDAKNLGSNLNNILTIINNLLQNNGRDVLQNKDKVERVRQIRNNAQHEARYPTRIEIDESLIYVRDFLNDATQLIWGFSFEAISLVRWIRNQFVRDLLRSAEEALEEGDFALAVHKANQGISWAINALADEYDWTVNSSFQTLNVVSSEIFNLDGINGIETDEIRTNIPIFGNPQKEILRRLYSTISNLEIHALETNIHLISVQQSLLIISLGLNHAEWLRFRNMVPVVDSQDEKIPEKILNISKKDAAWVIAFVINALIDIEDCVGDINLPNFANLTTSLQS